MPALFIEGDRRIRRQGGKEPIIGRIEAARQPGGRFGRIGRQPCCAEELLAVRRPGGIEEKEIVKLTKARAAPNPDIALLDLVPQGGQDGTFVSAAIDRAVGPYKGAQALRKTRVRQLLGQGPAPRDIEVAEEGDGV